MTVLGIEHIALVCKDTVGLAKWYMQKLGLVETYNNKKTPPTILLRAQNGIMLEFVPSEGKPRYDAEEKDEGWRHLAILVKDFDHTVADLTKRNVEWVGEAKVSSTGTTKARFLRDPEGNLVHIIERMAPL